MRPEAPAPIPNKPELLAPAGSWEAALAALEAGADALYVGLQEWSARGRAKNFRVEDLQSLVPLARSRSRKVYVALNTLLREEEMPRALRTVWDLACLGVDALIIQDLGLWAACRESFPELSLHASTQMSVHNSAGVRQLEAMGFSRAVLARECTIPEIARIRERTNLPLEVFVHGALCYSVSGLCLASSVLLGRSANRGWCGQPCRWGYRHEPRGKEVHPFSCGDLSLVERVWDLARAGVSSLKIEGRLKPADYVHTVVRAYRKVLDAPAKDRAGALGAAREILSSVASRPSCEGYAFHPRPKDVLRAEAQTGLGQRVGRVLSWEEGTAVVRSEIPLGRGDRIRIGSQDTGQAKAAVLREVRRESAGRNHRVAFSWAARAHSGDIVYRVKSARGEELEQRLSKELRSLPRSRGFPIVLHVALDARRVRADARCGTARAVVEEAVDTHPAEEHPIDAAVLERHLGKLGGTGYWLERLEVRGSLPCVVVPPSSFKRVRQALVEALDAARGEEARGRLKRAASLRLPRVERSATGPRLWLAVETAAAVSAMPREGTHRVVVSLTRDTLKHRERIAVALGSKDRAVWALPPWIAEGDLEPYRKTLETLFREGWIDVLVSNLGHLDLLRGLGFRPRAGWELHALNGWAASALGRLGCSSFVPSPESDRENLEAMARSGWLLPPLALVYGDLPLFTARLHPGGGMPQGSSVRASDGQELRWVDASKPLGQAFGRVVGSRPLSWTEHRRELEALGIEDFLVVLETRRYPEGEVRAILRRFRAAAPVPGATDANFRRGLGSVPTPRSERRREDEVEGSDRRRLRPRARADRGDGRRSRVRAEAHGPDGPPPGRPDLGPGAGGKEPKAPAAGRAPRRRRKDR